MKARASVSKRARALIPFARVFARAFVRVFVRSYVRVYVFV